MKFAELTPGRRIVLGPVSTDAEEIMSFARQYDTQWFHTDPERAEAGPWKGLIASGWHTCALAMQLVSRQVLADSESYVSPGLESLRWPNPVRPGDRLTVELTVHEQRISSSKPWLGVVRWQWVMRNQDGAEVLDIVATNLFKIRDADQPPQILA
ncbi:MAG: MaoC domain protein dehydratase [Noviherbaspirillum sp.]|nr:MaoC domain protein dehydratase [Noviherbaspirillum sp.]